MILQKLSAKPRERERKSGERNKKAVITTTSRKMTPK